MPETIVLSPAAALPHPIRAAANPTDDQVNALILLVQQSGILTLPTGRKWDSITALSVSRQNSKEGAEFWAINAVFKA